MRIRSVFVAYPYKLGQEYRDSLRDRFEGTGVEFRYADDRLENTHVMEKIRRMMSESDVSFFDITGNNPNVMLELGYALGSEQPGFVVVQEGAVGDISADITGWDQLRYTDLADLAAKLHDRITKHRVPSRVQVPLTQQTAEQQPEQIIRQLHFGIPTVDVPALCVYVVPLKYERYYKDRSLLGTHPYRNSDLVDSVLAGPNTTHYRTFFWAQGFNYAPHPGPDFIEVYDGRGERQSERITNFRQYTSGAAVYMQRLREGGANHVPFLYLSMYEQIVEMALIAMADARKRLDFESQGPLALGTVVLHAPELRVSEASGFYPTDDAGGAMLRPSDEMWIPEIPLIVDGRDLHDQAKDLANQLAAELRAGLD